MDEQYISKDASRKRKERERENPEERETRRQKDRDRNKQRINNETIEQSAKRLKYQRKKIQQRRDTATEQDQNTNGDIGQSNCCIEQVFEQPIASELSETDRRFLQKFRNEMDKIQYVLCPICNERYPSMVLVQGKCRRCYKERTIYNKFSAENNMDPGDHVPDELQGLTEIEEMLIAKVFVVMSREPSSLDVLIVRRQNESDLTAFRDFTVRRAKISRARKTDLLLNYSHKSFVPHLPSPSRENVAINNTLDRIQKRRGHTNWPQIDNSPINEFRTPGYIAMAFPTLYPTGNADLRARRPIEVKPAEYFKHLLKYKDGRFGRHTRVTDIQEKIAAGDKHMADRIMQFGEGLRGSRQFWKARRCELSDMIKQLGTQGMIFFTFSSADLHWPC